MSRLDTIKGPTKRIALPSKFELSDEEKAEIEAEALAEIALEHKKKKKQEYKKALLDEHRKSLDPGNFIYEEVIIDVAGHADRITIDNKVFFHGCEYTVSSNVAASLNEIMWRTHQHEAEVGFANRDQYRPPRSRPKNMMVTPRAPNGLSMGAAF